ncbi:tRNA (adenosine(37)-N6)-dimethylallyltransferase [Chitinimonas naiadis]
MSDLPRAIFLMGPTASGKTALAVALSKQLPVELISVDSALIYRDMDIGTAKPDAATLAEAPHHLIDIIDPTESYSAARFRHDALSLMADITARGRIPLLVGGTMLYFKALEEGLHELPSAEPAIRLQLEADAASVGWPAMHARLLQLDPPTGQRLNPNDSQRVGRALEIVLATGKPMSQWLLEQRDEPLPYRLTKLALLPDDRAVLHERIALRFEQMLAAGFLDEVERLRSHYELDPDMPSMRCVGYRQAWQYLDGRIDYPTLRDTGIYATRQLAKRQITWLRSMREIMTVDAAGFEMDEIAALLR